jgi:hypothetical protein
MTFHLLLSVYGINCVWWWMCSYFGAGGFVMNGRAFPATEPSVGFAGQADLVVVFLEMEQAAYRIHNR